MNDRRKGRMVHILKREAFTPSEIAEGVNLTVEECYQLEKLYLDSRPPRLKGGDNVNLVESNTRAMANMIVDWALENGRWPRSREFGYYNGLPSTDALQRWRGHLFGRDHGGVWTAITTELFDRLTPSLVMTIPNQTHMRNAISRYGGIERILKDGGGRFVQKDDYGTLWETPTFELTNDERALWVEVVNSTPRKDPETYETVLVNGKPVYDHYFLRVPPDTETARDAVAWTGWLDGETRIGYSIPSFSGFAAQS